jgi:hypothetical protein
VPPDATGPLVEVLATDPTALRGASSAAFTFVRDTGAEADLLVQFAIAGTAVNGVDYREIKPELLIPAGFLAADVVIEPIADSPNHGNKTVVLTLTTNANYRLAGHARAAATIVDDLYNDKPPTVSLTSPTEGAVFTLPAVVTLEAAATDPDDVIKKVSFYANDRYLGAATNSPFTLNWTNPPVGAWALFARAVDAFGKSTLSAPVHITVTNAPPVINLLSPTDGATLPLGSTVTIQAEVTDSDDAVVKVQIYGDRRLLATLTNGPYAVVWSKLSPGKHTVTVRATDEFGLTSTATARFTLVNAPPEVKLVKPADGDNFPNHANIALEAEATDSDGSVARVSFWANNRCLGVDSQAPYTVTWKDVRPGLYSLTAMATDQYGARTVSKPVVISVSR